MKKIFLAVAIAAIAGVNVYKANATKAQVSDLSLSNVEQLAYGEDKIIRNGGGQYDCKYVPCNQICQWTTGAYCLCPVWACY